jgi:hypothetical protein
VVVKMPANQSFKFATLRSAGRANARRLILR